MSDLYGLRLFHSTAFWAFHKFRDAGSGMLISVKEKEGLRTKAIEL